jgi:hypothetical protein
VGAVERLYRKSAYTLYHKWRNRNSNLPVVLGNSFPKSGTHLLMQALKALEGIGPFFHRNNFVHTFDDSRPADAIRPPQQILQDIHALVPGEICGGHILATQANVAALNTDRFVHYFIFRDPRDVVVSHAFYVTDMSLDHRLHRYYTEKLGSMEERIAASIVGAPDPALQFVDIYSRFEPYLGWLALDNVMAIRFEDVLNQKRRILGQMLGHLESRVKPTVARETALRALEQAIDPARSPTFREGKTASWKRHFTDHHKDLFKQTTGDLLIHLGYETNQDW